MNPIDTWLENVSPTSEETYRQYMLRFLEYAGLTAEEALKRAQEDKQAVHNTAKRWRNVLEKKGYASKTCHLAYAAVRSFFKWHDIKLGPTPRHFKPTITYERGRVLTPEEVWAMVNAYSGLYPLRGKAVILFLAQSGQRRGILTALRWSMFKEQIYNPPVIADLYRALLDAEGRDVRKEKVQYRFAIDIDATNALKGMMESRANAGEPIDDDSWLFRGYRMKMGNGRWRNVGKNEYGPPVTGKIINETVKTAAFNAGIQKTYKTALGKTMHEIHAHSLRLFWKSRVRMARWHDPEFRDFLMGHRLPYGGAYDKFNREYVRTAYLEAREQLSIVPKADLQTHIVKAEVRARLRNIPNEARRDFLEDMLKNMPYKTREWIKEDDEIKTILAQPKINPAEMKVVKPEELANHLNHGWTFIKLLKNGDALIKPGGSRTRHYEAKTVTEAELVTYVALGWMPLPRERQIIDGKIIIRREV